MRPSKIRRSKTRQSKGWKVALAALVLVAAWMALAASGLRPDAVAAASKHGFNHADLDTTCKPCQDFFRYATGGWIAHNPIQPAYPSWGRFNALSDKNQEVVRQILEEAETSTKKQVNAEGGKNLVSANQRGADSPPPGGPQLTLVAGTTSAESPDSLQQKIGDFYGSCMDTDRIEADGIKPLQPEFDRIATVQDLPELRDEVAHMQSQDAGVLFGFSSGQDDKDSTQVIAEAYQGGLSLPDRDYYLKTDDRSKDIRDKYQQHVSRMFQLAGDAPDAAAAQARTVLAIETQLATASKTRVQLRDPQANYHKLDLAQLRALTPDFAWDTYFRDIGFPAIQSVNVGQPEFFQALDRQLTSVPLSDWKIYLRWHLLHAAAPYLSSAFVNENFDFFNRTLTGAKELLPRWRRCVAATDRNLGEAVGQFYVARAFPPAAKAAAKVMVENLIAALRADIQTLPWMSPPTRQQALAKLSAMTLKIGYPDKWRDYSNYHVVPGPYIENLERGRQFAFHRQLDKIGKPVDRTEWGMSPPTVNAYYDPEMNEIVFPAGILQPPFYDPKADDAYNYGGIGAVIGHEMTHGFDDEGSQYDAQGNLRDWWTPEDRKNFDARAACVEKEFDSFVVADDVHENGKLVLGESIADLGGLTIAHMAYDNSRKGKPARKVDGFTPEERFFLGFARIWATTARPEYERTETVTDPHPLPRFRTDGALENLPEFAAAFDCKAGDPMVRPANERCRIW